jgi:hypothetical protein
VIGDDLPQKKNLAAAYVASSVPILDWHSSSVTERRAERKSLDALF